VLPESGVVPEAGGGPGGSPGRGSLPRRRGGFRGGPRPQGPAGWSPRPAPATGASGSPGAARPRSRRPAGHLRPRTAASAAASSASPVSAGGGATLSDTAGAGALRSKNRSSSTGTGMTSVLFLLPRRPRLRSAAGRSCNCSRVAGHHVGRRRQPAWRPGTPPIGGDDPGPAVHARPRPAATWTAFHAPRAGSRSLSSTRSTADTPRAFGRLIDDPAQFAVDGVPLGQQLIHLGTGR